MLLHKRLILINNMCAERIGAYICLLPPAVALYLCMSVYGCCVVRHCTCPCRWEGMGSFLGAQVCSKWGCGPICFEVECEHVCFSITASETLGLGLVVLWRLVHWCSCA